MTICKPSALVVVRVCPTGYSMGIGGKRLHCHSPAMYDEISGTWYNAIGYATKDFTQTETLHYRDGSSIVSRETSRNMEPVRAVSVTHISPIGGRVEFWMDHDPRIVGVEYSYTAA